jgi:hypothetical protein
VRLRRADGGLDQKRAVAPDALHESGDERGVLLRVLLPAMS